MTSPPIAFATDEPFDLAALRQQDSAEFERLYRAYAPRLQLYLYRVCGDRELAQDALQETFVKVYRALPRTSPDLCLRPWLYKVATNQLRSTLRLAGWRRVLPFSDQPATEQLIASGLWENRQAEAELVEKALSALKPEYASALLLHWHEGFSLDELASALGLNREALKKRLYRAKRAFITAYNRELAATQGEG